MATNLYRRDEVVTDAMGNPISGVQVFLCNQPANTSTIPPTPLAQVYLDPLGQQPINQVTAPGRDITTGAFRPSQQLITDQNGHCEYYAPAGIYTVVYSSPQIGTPTQTIVLPDQIVSGVVPVTQYAADSTANGTINPLPDGVQTEFNLSQAPSPVTSVVLAVNGLVVTNYTLLPGLKTVVFPSAPHAGSVITANYSY